MKLMRFIGIISIVLTVVLSVYFVNYVAYVGGIYKYDVSRIELQISEDVIILKKIRDKKETNEELLIMSGRYSNLSNTWSGNFKREYSTVFNNISNGLIDFYSNGSEEDIDEVIKIVEKLSLELNEIDKEISDRPNVIVGLRLLHN